MHNSRPGYELPWMFHPTQLVDDLEQAGEWFQRVFGRHRVTWAERWDLSQLSPEYPVDYSFWIMIGEVVHDVICPALYKVDGDAVPWGEHSGLSGISWWVKNSSAFAAAIEAKGLTLIDQAGQPVRGGRFARSLLTDEFTLMSMKADEAGFPHTFSEILGASKDRFAHVDHRLGDGWHLASASPQDPLGIIGCAWQTLSTVDIERAKWLFTEVLDGQYLGQARDAAGAGDAHCVFCAHTVIELVGPRGTAPVDAAAADTFDSITLLVQDLDKVRAHLNACDIRTTLDEADIIRTDPRDCMGVTWGFTRRLAPADPRVTMPAWAALTR
ncbi:VOC family protein [Pseudomonas typographi]|uniref:VOC family protein n=1 Tax=Pseudomonas typographi TaxID=2715964 RepID=A0ABR7Z598_9PSED|nr:VOC family protein [Pseudomonas typographi]MBD1600548.1 VOC family protein [Pseudomonas typographi]